MAKISERPVTILMADDDHDDQELTRKSFSEALIRNELITVGDGAELLDYLKHRGRYTDAKKAPRPALILLDLNMPKMDGREALAEIKNDPDLRKIPVIVMTTSKAEEDILQSYDLGVSSYIQKPVSFSKMVGTMRALKDFWIEIVEIPSSLS